MLVASGASGAAEKLPAELKGVTIAERLGKTLALDTPFVDHLGQQVTLARYFKGDLPVVLTLNYYRCKTLCSLQLNALVAGFQELGWPIGKKFRVVTISINPQEGPRLAKAKRQSYLDVLNQGEVEWSFLVGKKSDIDRVADAVGFRYRLIKKTGEYAHPAAIYVLSPTGKISRYLYGVRYPGQQLKFALMDASEGKVGTTVDRLILSCFHYDPTDGQYGPFAFGIMRLGGVVTVIGLTLFLGLLWRRERRKNRRTLTT